MARNIGPEMLEILDDALAKGQISPARHEAKRAEVLELIRKGKAVELDKRDRMLQALYFVGGAVVFLLLLALQIGLFGFLLGVAFWGMMIVAAARVGRAQ